MHRNTVYENIIRFLFLFSIINLSSIFFYDLFVQLYIVYHIIFKLLSQCQSLLKYVKYKYVKYVKNIL